MNSPLFYETVSPPLLELLQELMTKSYLSDFHLVGGTALSLMRGHRQSVDIDLFTANSFDSKLVRDSLENDFDTFESGRLSSYGLTCKINGIKVDIYYWNESLLNPIETVDGLRLISDDDIFAMKLETICTRREKKDFIDLAELLTDLTLEWGINCHQKKYKTSSKSLLMVGLASIDEADDTFMPIIRNGMTWETGKQTIQKATQEYVWLEKQRAKDKYRF
jgi:predicted nucleotidyltransferase component of viral defense system